MISTKVKALVLQFVARRVYACSLRSPAVRVQKRHSRPNILVIYSYILDIQIISFNIHDSITHSFHHIALIMASSEADLSKLTEDQQLALQQFTSVTDQGHEAAIPLLERCQWNVQVRICISANVCVFSIAKTQIR